MWPPLLLSPELALAYEYRRQSYSAFVLRAEDGGEQARMLLYVHQISHPNWYILPILEKYILCQLDVF